jgi:hypothetical protein
MLKCIYEKSTSKNEQKVARRARCDYGFFFAAAGIFAQEKQNLIARAYDKKR